MSGTSKLLSIPEFSGILQNKDPAVLPISSAADARNMDTTDGNLSTAKGFTKHIATAIPGTARILKLIIAKASPLKYIVVTADAVYYYGGSTWSNVHTFSTALTTRQIDHIQIKIGNDDYVIIATGETQMLKVKTSDGTTTAFGTASVIYTSTVASYNASTKTITAADAFDDAQMARMLLVGVLVNDVRLAVSACDIATKAITLKETPATAPAASHTLKIRGGASDAHTNYVVAYTGRLFAAGDPDATNRLYWSTVPGDTRSYEDWLMDDGSPDASGGFVEVGDNNGDPIIGLCAMSNQLVIFKRYTVYRLYGNRPSNYTIECIETASENMSNASVILKQDAPYWLTAHGIQYFNNVSVQAIDGGARQLRTFMAGIDCSESKGCTANNMLYLTCRKSSGNSYDDSIIVLDGARGTYMIRDGFNIADLISHDGKVYLINDNRYVYLFEDGTDYDGEPINAYWLSQYSDLDGKFTVKEAREIFARVSGDAIRFSIITDNTARQEERNITSDGELIEIPISAVECRRLQFKGENIAGGSFSIQGGIDIIYDSNRRSGR